MQEGFELVKQGLVGCWLVKDLSRFGRDYLTVGQYTAIIFPSYDAVSYTHLDVYKRQAQTSLYPSVSGGRNAVLPGADGLSASAGRLSLIHI